MQEKDLTMNYLKDDIATTLSPTNEHRIYSAIADLFVNGTDGFESLLNDINTSRGLDLEFPIWTIKRVIRNDIEA